ncbi:MAG: ATP-binding protein [Pyrinomonadaceae bacterium]|nr:ATP-binding protein [Pyrinomonadaceae bacterium]
MLKKILIVDDHDDLSTVLTREFTRDGYLLKIVESRDEAVEITEKRTFDCIITDLDGEHLTAESNESDDLTCLPEAVADARSNIKAFKICVSNYKNNQFTEDELKNLVETTLNHKAKFVDQKEIVQNLHEKIEFEIPSILSLMHGILDYLMKRIEKMGVISSENSNLFVALDEAFVNAVKHGNKYDATKLVRITAEVSTKEVRFTIEDEGEGFNIAEIPDPTDPANLFKASGRGVLIIHNVMDEVRYNERGNRLEMVKKSRITDPESNFS